MPDSSLDRVDNADIVIILGSDLAFPGRLTLWWALWPDGGVLGCRGSRMKLVAPPDKFRGTATAREMAAAIGRAAATAGVDCIEVPMADGGEGLLGCWVAPTVPRWSPARWATP
ncbi:MAG: hypothetical protein Ct9H300mP12_01670 [Acidimicrobiales bacterium]|nr:MAG: hypothetical protein Ct9H300mP12_01670 [Acidimicrobiales bacterium]